MPFSTRKRAPISGGNRDAPARDLPQLTVRTGSGTWPDLSLDICCDRQLAPQAMVEVAR